MPPIRHRRRIAAGLALTLAVAGVAACGDDDDDAGAPSAEATTVTPAACDAFTALSGALAGDPSGIGGLADTFQRTAPSGLAAQITTVADAYRSMGAGGDPSAFGETAYTQAAGSVAAAYFAGCDLSQQLTVDGVDYAFEGIPAQVDAGRVGLRFTNKTEHDEPHELVLFKRNEGTTETVEQLLALPQEESMAKLSMAAVAFADRPGAQSVSMVDLEAGRYIAVCFLPVGGGEDGPPHAMSGMVAEFEAK